MLVAARLPRCTSRVRSTLKTGYCPCGMAARTRRAQKRSTRCSQSPTTSVAWAAVITPRSRAASTTANGAWLTQRRPPLLLATDLCHSLLPCPPSFKERLQRWLRLTSRRRGLRQGGRYESGVPIVLSAPRPLAGSVGRHRKLQYSCPSDRRLWRCCTFRGAVIAWC